MIIVSYYIMNQFNQGSGQYRGSVCKTTRYVCVCMYICRERERERERERDTRCLLSPQVSPNTTSQVITVTSKPGPVFQGTRSPIGSTVASFTGKPLGSLLVWLHGHNCNIISNVG